VFQEKFIFFVPEKPRFFIFWFKYLKNGDEHHHEIFSVDDPIVGQHFEPRIMKISFIAGVEI
jgi:hypothetical protein